MENKELKPCPFCCGGVKRCGIDNHECHMIWCANCGSIDLANDDDDPETIQELYDICVAKWNTRPAEQALQAEVTQLKGLHEKAKTITEDKDECTCYGDSSCGEGNFEANLRRKCKVHSEKQTKKENQHE